MKRTILALILVLAFVGIGLTVTMARAGGGDELNIPAAFGLGLNTALPPGPGAEVNHVILPGKIKVKEGGVVHFHVAGFHQVAVYSPGTKPKDIMVLGGNRVNDPINRIYLGPSPTGNVSPLSNARNRVESIAFLARGKYLVNCNVTGHFVNDDMFAFVKVKGGDDDDD